MKCPLRLRGITIPGCRPASEWCRRQQHRDWSEAKSGQAAVSYAATDCEAEALFSFLKTEIAWSFLDLTGTSMWAGGTQGCTHTHRQKTSSIFTSVHVHSHAHYCIHTQGFTFSHIHAQSHFSLFSLLILSLHVTHSLLLVIQSVPISVTQSHSLTLSSNPISPWDI